jgi:hypothetical protein
MDNLDPKKSSGALFFQPSSSKIIENMTVLVSGTIFDSANNFYLPRRHRGAEGAQKQRDRAQRSCVSALRKYRKTDSQDIVLEKN